MNSKHRHPFQISLPTKVVRQILRDPVMLQRLSDRVYELLREELRSQRERSQGYGGKF